jgi:energy-coupling factor transporter ATP-binding protein EcfA2
MKLTSVKVEMFRNFLNSTEVNIDEKVTCLVGKNESGKSAFLHALWRLKPARSNPKFSPPDNYPAWLEKRHRNEGKDLEEVQPIQASLKWQDGDVRIVEKKFGLGVVKIGDELRFSKAYDNSVQWVHECSEKQAVKNFVAGQTLPNPRNYDSIDSFVQLDAKLTQEIEENAEYAETLAQLKNSRAALKSFLGDKEFDEVLWSIIFPRLPEFFYFAEYSKLPYSAKIDRILKEDGLDEAERTARSLLILGGTENDYILNPDYERRKRELENVRIGAARSAVRPSQADDVDLTDRCTLDSDEQAGNQRQEVGQPVCPCAKNDDRHRQARQVLLRREVLVDGDENVEMPRRKRQQLAVLQ